MPGTPFVTCDLGQFEDAGPDGASAPQRWYIRPTSAGDLRVDLQVLATSLGERGVLAAKLYDPGGILLGETSASPPARVSPGAANVASLRIAVVASAIYRLEIGRGAAIPSADPPRHYRLGFAGVPVEVGLNSPAPPRWFEGLNFGRQLFHVNVDPSEGLQLVLTAGEGQPIPSFTVEVRDEDGALLLSATWQDREPFSVDLAPSRVGRSLQIVTFGNHHFSLDKRSGSDRGIYLDACPPPAPPR